MANNTGYAKDGADDTVSRDNDNTKDGDVDNTPEGVTPRDSGANSTSTGVAPGVVAIVTEKESWSCRCSSRRQCTEYRPRPCFSKRAMPINLSIANVTSKRVAMTHRGSVETKGSCFLESDRKGAQLWNERSDEEGYGQIGQN
jgi:hypothetical protein